MTTVLLLPGWLDSGPTHWQSHWEVVHQFTRVQQHDWQRPLRGDWTARLEEVVVNHLASFSAKDKALLKSELFPQYSIDLQPSLPIENSSARSENPTLPAHAQRSVVLVAHSLGCHLVAAWAAASRHTAAIRGALLVAPPDLSRADLPPDLTSWRKPIPGLLPFPATCVVSSNDPFGSLAAGQSMAAAWGARCVQAGPQGHINGDSGLGDWPAGYAMLTELIHLGNPTKDAHHGH
jgi:uncharacterized protein